jgi:hypothetical protein
MGKLIVLKQDLVKVESVAADNRSLSGFLVDNGVDVKKLRELLQEFLVQNGQPPEDDNYMLELDAWYRRMAVEGFLGEL